MAKILALGIAAGLAFIGALYWFWFGNQDDRPDDNDERGDRHVSTVPETFPYDQSLHEAIRSTVTSGKPTETKIKYVANDGTIKTHLILHNDEKKNDELCLCGACYYRNLADYDKESVKEEEDIFEDCTTVDFDIGTSTPSSLEDFHISSAENFKLLSPSTKCMFCCEGLGELSSMRGMQTKKDSNLCITFICPECKKAWTNHQENQSVRQVFQNFRSRKSQSKKSSFYSSTSGSPPLTSVAKKKKNNSAKLPNNENILMYQNCAECCKSQLSSKSKERKVCYIHRKKHK